VHFLFRLSSVYVHASLFVLGLEARVHRDTTLPILQLRPISTHICVFRVIGP
jgi:hypothetical protein